MRRTRRTAWGLVAASAAMNAAHAPGNWIATVVFALVPAVSAKLIEHELDKLLSANAEEEEDATPGLVRLFQLGYVHVWAAVFARLGLDATNRDGVIHQDARIRRAARKIRSLGIALNEMDVLQQADEGTGRRAQRDRGKQLRKANGTVEALRAKAELAIDVAGIAGDTPAQLMLARHLTARGRVVDLARMDTSNPMSMVALLEDLSIVPSAAAIEEGARAAQARKEREQAEQGRDTALKALAEAKAEAEKTRGQAASDLDEAEASLKKAKEATSAVQKAAEEAEETRRRAVDATKEAQEGRDKLAAEIEQLRTRAGELKTNVDASEDDKRAMAEKLTALQTRADELRGQVKQYEQAAAEAQEAARRALAAKSVAAGDVERAQTAVVELARKYETIERETAQLAEQQREALTEIKRLSTKQQEAEAQVGEATAKLSRMLDETREADRKRNAAVVALQAARESVLEALTAPETTAAPRWTSPAKIRGWELYLHTVHTEGHEPTDQELAGDDRDTSTARRWLADFRAELARITATELPSQEAAHSRTPDRAPALV